MKVHRTLLIRRPLMIFNEEERNALIKVLTRADALGNLWARGYKVHPPDISPKFAHEFNYFKDEISFSNGVKPPKAWYTNVHAMLSVGVRLSNERDNGEGVFIDLTRSELRLRWIIKGRAITIKLTESEVKYIRDRLNEGGRPKLARVWVGGGYLYVAVTFEREVQPIQPSEYILVIDVNSWRNGIAWGLVRGGGLVKVGRERPDLGRIERLYNEVVVLERRYGNLKRLDLHRTVEGKELWREVKRLRRRLYAYLRDYAQKLAHRLARKALRHRALVIIDDMIEESRRELLEEGLNNGLTKLYLTNLKRFVKLLTNQLEWYGIPYEFKRLPSTICPVCGHELRQLPNRVMICDYCGFRENRDYVPIKWVIKLTTEKTAALTAKARGGDVNE